MKRDPVHRNAIHAAGHAPLRKPKFAASTESEVQLEPASLRGFQTKQSRCELSRRPSRSPPAAAPPSVSQAQTRNSREGTHPRPEMPGASIVRRHSQPNTTTVSRHAATERSHLQLVTALHPRQCPHEIPYHELMLQHTATERVKLRDSRAHVVRTRLQQSWTPAGAIPLRRELQDSGSTTVQPQHTSARTWERVEGHFHHTAAALGARR